MLSLESKKILITGASSGIGKATAILFSKLGAQLVITGRNEQNLLSTFSQLNTNQHHKSVIADLTIKDDVEKLVSQINDIDGIVHCCGKVFPVPVKYIKSNQLQDVFEVNYFSAVNLISKLLQKNKINNKSSIVFISSVSTLYSYYGGAPYVSSKSALEAYAKTLALELVVKKIRVNVLQPALVDTPIFETTIDASVNEEEMKKLISKYPLGIGTVDDISNACAYFSSDISKWITGSFLKMDGGLTLGVNM